MNKTVSEVSNCTGCGACFNLCPKRAISMQKDDEGFLYPVIDRSKCCDCSLCYMRCPVENPCFKNKKDPLCLAIAGSDEIRENSSSGGVFGLLAEYVLDNGGYVVGAAWGEDNLVRHIIINDKKDLYKLKSSKYLQSNTSDIYIRIKELLDEDKKVFFTGTPCQVAGLYAVLKKEYPQLLTTDIVCHGVPSPAVYQKYIKENFNHEGEKVLYTNFRDKVNGWTASLTTTTTTTTTYSCPANKDDFMQAFLKNMCLRPSCSKCPFAKMPRQGDITLGDFWGINKYSKKLNDNKGTSLVLINSVKGETYLKSVQQKTKIYKQVPLKFGVKGNPCLVRSSYPHADRRGFFDRLNSFSLKDNVKITEGQKYDCGILNFWFGSNFGAMLTCYGLQETIKSFGLYPRVINYIPPQFYKKYNGSKSESFALKYLLLTKFCKDKKELQTLNEETDTFIVGSDQVWRYPYYHSIGNNIFHLNFAAADKKKIACAVSFGVDFFEGTPQDTKITKYYVNQFDNISVREDTGVELCKNVFNVDATHILDPVFMADKSVWNKILEKADKIDESFIASYVLDKSKTALSLLSVAKNKFDLLKSFDMADGSKGENTSVENWLWRIKNAKFFITDSFHGVCFAVIFNKPFIVLANKSRGYSRFKSLLALLNLEDRLILDFDLKTVQNLIDKPIDYQKVNQILNEKIILSKKWLKSALMAQKKSPDTLYDMVDALMGAIEEKEELLFNAFKYPKLKRKLLFYKIMSKLARGKKRKIYKQKSIELKSVVKQIKSKLKK